MQASKKEEFPPSLKAIQHFCQERWKQDRLFYTNPNYADPGNKFLITIPMPYTDSLISLNRAYTLMVADIMASYQQMKGKNVLLPLFFHYGGTRIQVFNSVSLASHSFCCFCF